MVGICRLCATIRKGYFYDIQDDADEICQKLLDCCSLEILVEDNLPKTVCNECLHALQMAHEFYRKVHESQKSLQALIPENKCESKNINLQRNDENYAKVLSVVVVSGSHSKEIEQEVEVTVEKEEEEDEEEEEAHTNYSIEFTNEDIDDVESVNENLDNNHHKANFLPNRECDENGFEDIEELEEHLIRTEVKEEEDNNKEEHFDNKTNKKLSSITLEVKQVNDWSDLLWMCNTCAEIAPTYGALIKHAEEQHRVKATDVVFRCTNCQKRCARYLNFLNHVRFQHHERLALLCDLCNMQFADFKELAAHRNICDNRQHCINALVMCPKCGKAFSNYKAQYLHDRMQHRSVEKAFDCQQCGKKFKRLFTLRTHERVHSASKDYSCEICGRAFRQKINMETHMHVHSEEKHYECAICKKCFKTAANLNKHGLIHTDIKEFKCQYCDKEFRTNDAKISHERIHTGEMPYKCEYCQKSFRFRSTFSSHLYLHTGERPYSCMECNHHFTNWSNYNKHMKRRHNH